MRERRAVDRWDSSEVQRGGLDKEAGLFRLVNNEWKVNERANSSEKKKTECERRKREKERERREEENEMK